MIQSGLGENKVMSEEYLTNEIYQGQNQPRTLAARVRAGGRILKEFNHKLLSAFRDVDANCRLTSPLLMSTKHKN